MPLILPAYGLSEYGVSAPPDRTTATSLTVFVPNDNDRDQNILARGQFLDHLLVNEGLASEKQLLLCGMPKALRPMASTTRRSLLSSAEERTREFGVYR